VQIHLLRNLIFKLPHYPASQRLQRLPRWLIFRPINNEDTAVAAALRVDPKDYFTSIEWAGLSRRSSWRGLWLIAHCWATIVLAGALFVLWPNPVTLLMHDAAHAALHTNLKLNDITASWLCGAPVGASLQRYRPYHLTHHKFAQQPEDPDLSLSAPFPITAVSLRRKMVRDLTGQTFFKQRIRPTIDALLGRKAKGLSWRQVGQGLWGFWGPFVIANSVMILALSAIGLWWAWPVLWLLPMASWYPLVTRLRNIAEHACTPDHDDPLRHARTTRANLLERLFIAPYFVNYHCEHHMFMHLPCWSLPKAHRLLTAKGATARMEVQPGYLAVIRAAASRQPKGKDDLHRKPDKAPTFAAPFG
jgi:fatty acid desaturase